MNLIQQPTSEEPERTLVDDLTDAVQALGVKDTAAALREIRDEREREVSR